MRRDTERYAWNTCACGKKGYVSRRAARNRMKAYHPDDSNLNVYRCKINDQMWHYGHLGPDGRDFHRRTA
jgi:hypothetical protein